MAVYFQFRKGRYDHVKEFAGGSAIADYDKNGYLLGVELIAPCKVKIVDELAAEESPALRNSVKRFMRSTGPRELVATR